MKFPHGTISDHPTARRAFTLVELLVVIGVIAVLVGMLLVGLSKAYRYARESQTARLMQNVGTAIETFRNDFNYLPPLTYDPDFDPLAATATSPRNFRVPESVIGAGLPFADMDDLLGTTASRALPFRFGSEHTIATYLVGLGDTDGSSFDTDPSNDAEDLDDGAPGPGVRAPGPDHSWGGAMDRVMQSAKRAKSQAGRVYGPYLDIASLDKNLSLDPNTGLFRVLDVWGNPIRYYKGWYTRDPSDPNTLSIARVPLELRTVAGLERQFDGASADLTLEQRVLSAPFMLLSAGPAGPLACDAALARPRFGDFYDPPGGGMRCRLYQEDLTDAMFSPTTLAPELQQSLLEDLKDNVRYTP